MTHLKKTSTRIGSVFFLLICLFAVAPCASAQYYISLPIGFNKLWRLGGLPLKSSDFAKTDSTYVIITKLKSSLTSRFNLLAIDEYSRARNYRLDLIGNYSVNSIFPVGDRLYVSFKDSKSNTKAIHEVHYNNTEVNYLYDNLKLGPGPNVVLEDQQSNSTYLLYSAKHGKYQAHRFTPSENDKNWFNSVFQTSDRYFTRHAFQWGENLGLLEMTNLKGSGDLYIKGLNGGDGRLMSKIKLNSDQAKLSAQMVKTINERVFIAGRNHYSKKMHKKKPGEPYMLSFDKAGDKNFQFIPKVFGDSMVYWQDVIPTEDYYYLIGETFSSKTNTAEALAMGIASGLATGGVLSVSSWTDNFKTFDAVVVKINKSDLKLVESRLIPLPETLLKAPDGSPYWVAGIGYNLRWFKYKGFFGETAVFESRYTLHFINLNDMTVEERPLRNYKLFNFHTDLTKPLELPSHGLLLYNEEGIIYSPNE